jgi:hypothetical protein
VELKAILELKVMLEVVELRTVTANLDQVVAAAEAAVLVMKKVVEIVEVMETVETPATQVRMLEAAVAAEMLDICTVKVKDLTIPI